MLLLPVLPLLLTSSSLDVPDAERAASSTRDEWRATSTPPVSHGPWRWVDWSGDGRLDALHRGADGALVLLEQNDEGRLQDRTAWAGLANRTFTAAEFADLDGDGRLDLAALDANGLVALFLQTERGGFEAIAVTTTSPGALATRTFDGVVPLDMQGDGHVDLQLVPRGHDPSAAGVLLAGRGDLTFDVVELPRTGAAAPPSPSARTSAAGTGSGPAAAAGTVTGIGTLGLGGLGGVLACAGAIEDVVTTACIEASSIPQLGYLFPISPEWFIDSTGLVGIGTTTPQARLDVSGSARASRFISTVTTGQPPFQIASRTLVPLLNADSLDGMDGSDFRSSATPITGADILDGSIDESDLATGSVGASELQPGAVTAGALGTGAVTSTAILDGSVTSADLAASSVGSSKLQDDSVNSFKILDGSIFPPDFSAGAVDSAALASGAVTESKLAASSVSAAKIASGAVTDSKVAPRSLTGGSLALGTITSAEIANGSIGSAQIQNGSVTSSDLAAGAVVSTSLAAGAVGASALANGAVTSASIAAGAVGAAALQNGAVTSAAIAPGAVGSSELANGAVDTAQLAVGAVTSASILDATIRSADLADGSIDSAALAPGAVDASALAPGAVRSVALATGAVTSAAVLDGSLNGGDFAVGAVGGREIANGSIGDQEIGAAASIAGTKIAPNFGAQDVASTGSARFGDPAGVRAELAPFGAGLRAVGAPLAAEFLGNVTMAAGGVGQDALDVTHTAGETAATVRLEDPTSSSTSPALHVLTTGNGAARGVLVESLGLGNTGSAFQVIHHGAGPGLDITSGALPLLIDRSINSGPILEARNLSDTEFRVDSSGDVFCDGAFLGGGADYAEWLPHANAGDALEAADVVAVRGGRIAHALPGADRYMVVSTNPCVIGNHPEAELDAPEDHSPVAFVGQVPVKVRGACRVGDVLVPSGLGDGFARALPPAALSATELASMLGTAWSATPAGVGPEAEGQVVALVGVGEAGAAATALARMEVELAARDALLEDLVRRVEALERR